jgi:hypothetical protein
VSEPTTISEYKDTTIYRNDTENNKTLETTIRNWTDTTTTITTITTTTITITTIRYSDGKTEVFRSEPSINQKTIEDVKVTNREEIIGINTLDPIIETIWEEELQFTSTDPQTTTEFLGENTVRTRDDLNGRWIDTTTQTYRDTTTSDTITTKTRTPIYRITYRDGTIETEVGESIVTTSTTNNLFTEIREVVNITYEDYPIAPILDTQTNTVQTQTFNPITAVFEPTTFTLSFSYPNTFDSGVSLITAINNVPIAENNSELFVLKPIESIVVEDRTVDYTIPPDTFGHTDPNAKVDVTVKQGDGSDLPPTLFWDPVTGKLSGTLPEGQDVVEILIEATDENGSKVEIRFTIRAGEVTEVPQQQAIKGKPSLTEQIAKAIEKLRASV